MADTLTTDAWMVVSRWLLVHAAWDLEHQRKLYRSAASQEEALAKIAAYEENRREVEVNFMLAYEQLTLAATQSDEASLASSAAAVKRLLESIAKLQGGP